MLTLSFISVAELKPKHKQKIIWARPVSGFGCDGYEYIDAVAEYSWIDGNGTSYGYKKSDKPEEGFDLVLNFVSDSRAEEVGDEDFWCLTVDYWKAIDIAVKKAKQISKQKVRKG